MEPKTDRKWFKKKRYIIPAAAIVGIIALGNMGSHYQNAEQTVVPVPVVTKTTQDKNSSAVNNTSKTTEKNNSETPTFKATSPSTSQDNPPTSEVNYYQNTQGNTVQSPTHYNEAPAGASAQCRDGSYSFSQSRSGTCSHHGGVAEWL